MMIITLVFKSLLHFCMQQTLDCAEQNVYKYQNVKHVRYEY